MPEPIDTVRSMNASTGLIVALQTSRATRAQRLATPHHKPLPLAPLPALPVTSVTWTHGMTKIDASGRLRDRSCWDEAGFKPGSGVTITSTDKVVTITLGGPDEVDARGRVKLPAPMRAWHEWHEASTIICSARPGVVVLRDSSLLNIAMDDDQ